MRSKSPASQVSYIVTFKLRTFKDVNMEVTNDDLMELEAQRKDKEGKKEDVTEELKRFTLQGIAGEFSVFEGALLIFEPQDPNVD